jgi:hypothetical protein
MLVRPVCIDRIRRQLEPAHACAEVVHIKSIGRWSHRQHDRNPTFPQRFTLGP